MKHHVLLVWLLCLGGFFSFGQKPILIPAPPPTACVDADLSLPFTSSVAFEPGNSFRLQFRRTSDYTGAILRDTPVQTVNGAFAVRFPDPRNLGVGDYELGSEYSYRILSSNPVAESDWIPVRLRYPARLLSVAATPGAVNPDEGTPVEFRVSGSPPVTVTFTDSSRLALIPTYTSDVNFLLTLRVYGERTQSYRVATVRNECGPGTGGGQFDAVVNPFSLRITSLSATNLCEGSTLTLAYSRLGGTFEPGNRFRVLLTPQNSGSGFPVPAELTLEATEENGVVRAVFPKNTPFDEGRTLST